MFLSLRKPNLNVGDEKGRLDAEKTGTALMRRDAVRAVLTMGSKQEKGGMP